MNKSLSLLLLLLATLLSGLTVNAEVTLPAYFSDNMIVQRDTILQICGKSSHPGAKVTVIPGWDKKKYAAVASPTGDFSVSVKTPEAGGPYALTINDGEPLALNNILSGEVWICSGQSNMEMPVKGWGCVRNWEDELAAASHPSIRLLQVKHTTALSPLPPAGIMVNGEGWTECSPESLENFSAVAYFYARELADKLNIPIGVIDTSWGGTPAEAWTSIEVLTHVLDIDEYAAEIAACGGDINCLKAKYTEDVMSRTLLYHEVPESQNYPGNLYNAMIHPLTQFPIRGAIWYQGESNVSRWEQYTPLFQSMINNWRDEWGNDFPFYFVQLANYLPRQEVQPDSQWAHLREAQANALQLENTGMAVAIDIGEELDIHPKNKQEVGVRLARAALAGTYGKEKYEQPVMHSMKIKGNKAVLMMSRPLIVKGERATGFVICGPNMEFYPAEATINSNIITLMSPEVEHPVAVRYGWADNPECNLYTTDNMPLPPFRSDRFR